jgi:hypothetical protein
MKISYAITVCNELEEIKHLVSFLLLHKREEDEVIILFDDKGTKEDYIFQIDADEVPNITLIKHIPEILEINLGIDVLLVPRVNTVEGLTQEHIQKWGWVIDNQGWVNYPDFQWRIYKNTSSIKWVNKVHERLIGYKTISNLPQIEDYSLYHPKTIERQERQNNYYNTL